MSNSLKFLHMNQKWPDMINYWIYGTKRIEQLSKK